MLFLYDFFHVDIHGIDTGIAAIDLGLRRSGTVHKWFLFSSFGFELHIQETLCLLAN